MGRRPPWSAHLRYNPSFSTVQISTPRSPSGYVRDPRVPAIFHPGPSPAANAVPASAAGSPRLVSAGPRAPGAFPTPGRAACAPASPPQLASRPADPTAGPRPRPSTQRGTHCTAGNHAGDLRAQMRPAWGWGNTRPGEGLLLGPDRPGNAPASCTAGTGAGAGPTAAADGPGPGPGLPRGRLSRAVPLARGASPSTRAAALGPVPASAARGPAPRRPGASVWTPGPGRRRRGSDSPRAGGSPRRSPRAARCWSPGPWQRPDAGASDPERSADPVPPAPTRPLGAQLPAPGHVDALPRPPRILTLLATGRQLRLQGRARRRRPAVRGVPWTPIPAPAPLRPARPGLRAVGVQR